MGNLDLNTDGVLSFEQTHDRYIHAVREIGATRLNNEKEKARPLGAKLTYAAGHPGVRGCCLYSAWEDGALHEFIEVYASGEESAIQLAGTTF